ncbi:MAG TPA: thiamine phosphate synthase [Phycisphaerae bacterium]|nr:thiamine phosphate synthase [Phycisphaerae bacterium]
MNSPVFRILDANFNRAREALRVMEDYARFVLDDPAGCEVIKRLRHDLAQCLRRLPAEALLVGRDTPGDVGTAISTESERRRSDAADVFTAAAKRLPEALRTIEEYAKTVDPVLSAAVESLRYRAYDLEQRLALRGDRSARFARTRLYVLITESLCRPPACGTIAPPAGGRASCPPGVPRLLSRAGGEQASQLHSEPEAQARNAFASSAGGERGEQAAWPSHCEQRPEPASFPAYQPLGELGGQDARPPSDSGGQDARPPERPAGAAGGQSSPPVWLQVAAAAIAGGADCIQLREKSLDAGELLARARRLRELCHQHGVLFIVNDRPDLAVLADADGVHLGQTDLSLKDARRIVGPDRLIGLSTHTPEQLREAIAAAPDYIAVGPMFDSATKPQDHIAGPDLLALAVRETRIPIVPIGGITAANAGILVQAGARRLCVCSAVIGAADPKMAARELLEALGPRSEPGV